ncbi:hypothetical protein [Methylobacterium sp. D48H]
MPVADPDGTRPGHTGVTAAWRVGAVPAGLYQHEVWVTEVGKAPYPVTIGPVVIRGTVKGAAA